MLLGKYSVSDHIIERYKKRVKNKSTGEIKQLIKADLRTMNIKQVVYKGDTVYLFTKGHKEFIFVRERNRLILKTIIKRNLQETLKTIEKRKGLVAV